LWSVEGGASVCEQCVEGRAVVALAAIQELCVHVESHPAFGVADLMLHIGHVEVVASSMIDTYVRLHPASRQCDLNQVPDWSASCLSSSLWALEREANRRGEALALADELLGDIELDRSSPVSVARKAGRLARLLDDVEAMQWLSYETTGFPSGTLDQSSWEAVERSHRVEISDTGERTASITPLGKLAANIEGAQTQLGSDSQGVSSSEYAVIVENNRMRNSERLRTLIGENRKLLDRVVGAIHAYVADRYQELRFGSAVETAFSVVRQEVDGTIAELVLMLYR
jgi:AbiTii